MSHLSTIQTGIQPGPRRILLFGVQGVGKSNFASQAPKPIFIPTEDGLGTIDCARFPLAQSADDILKAIGALYTDPHDYRTVCLDSADWAERLFWQEVCRSRSVKSIEDLPYGRGYQFALTHWRELIDGLSALRNERGMTVIIIAHARIERFENPETEPYDRYVPRLHRTAAALLGEWCDEVLFATFRVFTKTAEEGFNRTRVQGIGTGERILRTSERPAHLAKSRLPLLPDELPLSWAEFARYLPQTNTAGPVKAG